VPTIDEHLVGEQHRAPALATRNWALLFVVGAQKMAFAIGRATRETQRLLHTAAFLLDKIAHHL
jgi:hypothetical protein